MEQTAPVREVAEDAIESARVVRRSCRTPWRARGAGSIARRERCSTRTGGSTWAVRKCDLLLLRYCRMEGAPEEADRRTRAADVRSGAVDGRKRTLGRGEGSTKRNLAALRVDRFDASTACSSAVTTTGTVAKRRLPVDWAEVRRALPGGDDRGNPRTASSEAPAGTVGRRGRYSNAGRSNRQDRIVVRVSTARRRRETGQEKQNSSQRVYALIPGGLGRIRTYADV